jgi:hypothetical protein
MGRTEHGVVTTTTPSAAADKARELLEAQRDSVDMLTMVRGRIESTLCGPAIESLRRDGFVVVDDFLRDEWVLDQMVQEATNTVDGDNSTAVDAANLGSGQYLTPLLGGDGQYRLCPRTVEFVVSSTRHLPKAVNDRNDDGTTTTTTSSSSSAFTLDASACMATLRSFDRRALKASLALFTGTDDDDENDKIDDVDVWLDGQSVDPSTLQVVARDEDDPRRLSVYYYVLPDEWDERCGGGLVFESGVVPARRDRLVLFYSDRTKCRTVPWRGSDSSPSTMAGHAIELHLVNKR